MEFQLDFGGRLEFFWQFPDASSEFFTSRI